MTASLEYSPTQDIPLLPGIRHHERQAGCDEGPFGDADVTRIRFTHL